MHTSPSQIHADILASILISSGFAYPLYGWMFFRQRLPHPVKDNYCCSEYKENYNHDILIKRLNQSNNCISRCVGNTCCKHAASTPVIAPAENYRLGYVKQVRTCPERYFHDIPSFPGPQKHVPRHPEEGQYQAGNQRAGPGLHPAKRKASPTDLLSCSVEVKELRQEFDCKQSGQAKTGSRQAGKGGCLVTQYPADQY